MIIDVPNSKDFEHSGLSYLNLAWGGVTELLIGLQESIEYGWIEDDKKSKDEYWQVSQRPLTTSITLLQQGIEFLLKARIVEVSPYLLIGNSFRDWPKRSNTTNNKFSSFKTLDAQDLIKVCDTVSDTRLPSTFCSLFEELRAQRNTIMHSIDSSNHYSARDILVNILEASYVLNDPINWMEIRSEFIQKEPNFLKNADSEIPVLAREALMLIKVLKPAEAKKYLGFNQKQRRYHCNECHWESSEWDLEVTTAQLKPNTPRSKSVYCFVCRKDTPVKRVKCKKKGCKGNVIDTGELLCLTCLEQQ